MIKTSLAVTEVSSDKKSRWRFIGVERVKSLGKSRYFHVILINREWAQDEPENFNRIKHQKNQRRVKFVGDNFAACLLKTSIKSNAKGLIGVENVFVIELLG